MIFSLQQLDTEEIDLIVSFVLFLGNTRNVSSKLNKIAPRRRWSSTIRSIELAHSLSTRGEEKSNYSQMSKSSSVQYRYKQMSKNESVFEQKVWTARTFEMLLL